MRGENHQGHRAGRKTGRSLVAAAILASLVSPAGAAPAATADRYLVPLQRFVDQTTLARRTKRPARASIRDDSRYVLRAYRSGVAFNRTVGPNRDGVFVHEFPKKYRPRTAILPMYATKAGQGFTMLPPQIIDGVDTTVRLEGLPRRRISLQLRSAGLVPQRIVDKTAVVNVPKNASLGFSIGILDIARHQGPVRFTVDFCHDAKNCEELFRKDLAPGLSWSDQHVPLPNLAGKKGRFRFTTLVLGDKKAWSFPVWANPTLWEERERPANTPNLVLLSIDTLRADHLNTYGYARETAPFLHRHFSEGGVVFERAYAAATTTGPSHMTMLTGLEPAVHGVESDDYQTRLPDKALTLAQILRANGFETGAVTENGPMGAARGFGRGFDQFSENKASGRFRNMHGFVEKTLADGAAFLRANENKRTFLFLHTFQVHTPYEPPPKYASLFSEPLPGEVALRDEWKPVLYDREIRYTDDSLKDFVENLGLPGFWDDTIFVVVSDHGEAFGEHGLMFHGGVPYDEVLRVPFLLRGPGVPAARRVAEPVGLIDVTPTVLDLLGIERPEPIMGRTLVPILGGTTEDWKTPPIYAEARDNTATEVDGPVRGKKVSDALIVRHEGEKFIHRSDGSHELFDLEADPGENTNLWAEGFERKEELLGLAEAYEKSGAKRREALEEGSGPTKKTEEIDPAREQKLRALGYID